MKIGHRELASAYIFKIMNENFFRKKTGIAVLGISLVLVCIAAIRIRSAEMNASEFFGGLFRLPGYDKQSVILHSVRLPRVLGAVLAGAGLSASGVLLQGITANPLAGPNIIGVNAGAGFAVIVQLWLFPTAVYLTPLAAFFGAFLTTLLIILVSSGISNSKSTVILAGIAVTALLNAGISFISLLDNDVLSTYNHFSIGGLSGVSVNRLPIPALLIILGIIAAMILNRRIDALCLGDKTASSLGINVRLLRTVCLIIASACAAAVVSYAGLLGFVGLIVPHISRKLCGNTIRKLLPVSVIIGGITVVLGDLLGRTLFAPSEIPVGIVMALIGAPFFFFLLIKKKA